MKHGILTVEVRRSKIPVMNNVQCIVLRRGGARCRLQKFYGQYQDLILYLTGLLNGRLFTVSNGLFSVAMYTVRGAP